MGELWVTIPLPLEPQSSALPFELNSPCMKSYIPLSCTTVNQALPTVTSSDFLFQMFPLDL